MKTPPKRGTPTPANKPDDDAAHLRARLAIVHRYVPGLAAHCALDVVRSWEQIRDSGVTLRDFAKQAGASAVIEEKPKQPPHVARVQKRIDAAFASFTAGAPPTTSRREAVRGASRERYAELLECLGLSRNS